MGGIVHELYIFMYAYISYFKLVQIVVRYENWIFYLNILNFVNLNYNTLTHLSNYLVFLLFQVIQMSPFDNTYFHLNYVASWGN